MFGSESIPKRVVVISDLHLGGAEKPMMSRPERLASFLGTLVEQRQSNVDCELVIAGDFIDFLAIEPWASWTPDAQTALEKLRSATDSDTFGPVFDQLRRLLGAGWNVTILLGNHDLELALPAVQAALLDRLSAGPHRVHFVDDGRAYRVGRLLIEHGNRYDGANANDWEYLRLIASAQSRSESVPIELRISMGSQFVHEHVNPLKSRYPFVDLIQPQNELVALLLLAFEPALAFDWRRIGAARKASRLQLKNVQGEQPGRIYQIAATSLDEPNPELAELFGEEYEALLNPPPEVGTTALVRAYLQNRKESLAEILARNEHVPAKRLAKIRALCRTALLNDKSDQLDGPTEQYGKAANRLMTNGHDVDAVIMGHTHMPRKVRMEHGWYLNTGTWIDRIRVPDEALEESADEELEGFLRGLLSDQRPHSLAHYADVLIGAEGQVAAIDLKEVA